MIYIKAYYYILQLNEQLQCTKKLKLILIKCQAETKETKRHSSVSIQKWKCTEFDVEERKIGHFENKLPQDSQCNADFNIMSGTLHQGDTRFMHPGVQCTFISFWALISMAIKSPHIWASDDIDGCVIEGDARYIEHCFERNLQPQTLLVTELPRFIRVRGITFTCHQLDDQIIVDTLAGIQVIDERNCLWATLGDALIKGLSKSDSCLFVCGGQTVAIAKCENKFYIFDPHSRGKDGMLHHTGNAVVVSFTQIQPLIKFFEKLLMQSLRLKPSEKFELVPKSISLQSDDRKLVDKRTSGTKYNDSEASPQVVKELHYTAQENAKINQNDLFDDNKRTTITSEQAMEDYFADQKRRDNTHKEKRDSEKLDSKPNNMDRTRLYETVYPEETSN